MIYAQPRICLGKWDAQTPLGFWHTNESSNIGQMTRHNNDNEKKTTCRIVYFALLADLRVKLQKVKRSISILTMVGNRKNCELESDDYSNFKWCSWYSHRRVGTGIGGLGNKMTNEDHPNYCIIEIGKNTEKSPGDMRRLGVTQTPV